MAVVLEQISFNINDICRLCLKKNNTFFNIFVLENVTEFSYASMISTLGGITVFNNDGLPSQICDKCKENLESAYRFRENILRTYDILCQTRIKLEIQENAYPSDNLQNIDNTASCDPKIGNPSSPISKENIPNATSTIEISDEPNVKLKNIKIARTRQKTTNNLNIDKIETMLSDKCIEKCPLCLKLIDENEDFTAHLQSHYESTNLTPLIVNGKKTESCNLCDKPLKYRTMVPHHRIHLKIYPFKCEIKDCDESFITPQYLTIHMTRHTGLKKYQCQTCGKTFGLRGSLKNHEETHIFESVQCKICHRTYKNNIMLKIHMKRHKNGLKFKCKEPGCDKAFYVLQELNRHLRVHNNERPYICNICNKAWFTNGELERHRRYHMKIRQYICKLCTKSFVERTQLRHHEMKHRNERPHICEYCSNAFVARSKLKRHQMKSCKSIKDISIN